MKTSYKFHCDTLNSDCLYLTLDSNEVKLEVVEEGLLNSVILSREKVDKVIEALQSFSVHLKNKEIVK